MSNFDYKPFLPHLGALFILMLVAFIYYAPSVGGKVLNQFDNVQAKGMQAELSQYREATGQQPLWTNSAFAGMPSYQIHMNTPNNWIRKVHKLFLLGNGIGVPHTATFLLMAMMYLLLITLGLDWKIGVIGAVAWGLSAYNVILMEAGHSTKVITLAYVPAIIAGILLIFRGKYVLGGGLTAMAMALEIYSNHFQITYYLGLALGIFVIIKLVEAIREKQLPDFAKAMGVVTLACLIGTLTSTSKLWTTYEYTSETIRGKSELTIPKPGQDSADAKPDEDGLTKDYAFGWSYGVGETFNVLIPNYMGGTTSKFYYNDQSSETFRELQKTVSAMPQAQQNQAYQSLAFKTTHYWGDQPGVDGPSYHGAIIIFLAILGFLLLKSPIKWWSLLAIILLYMIGWGKNFSAFNYLMFDYFPMFNKFRSVNMAMGVTPVFFIILAGLGLKAISTKGIEQSEKLKALYIAGGIAGGLCVLLWLGGTLGILSFLATEKPNSNDLYLLSNYPDLQSALASDRASLLTADAWRSFFFIAFAVGALWLFVTKRIKWLYTIIGVGVLILIDFWTIAQRFVNSEDFVEKKAKQEFPARQIDLNIKKDTTYYRVLDLSARQDATGQISRYQSGNNPYSSAIPSLYHKSIGGYHAAKLILFQDLVEHYLYNPGNSKILGMLNAKYVIRDTQQGPIPIDNPEALGNAWFVSDYELVEDADAEMTALDTLQPREKAIIQKKFKAHLEDLKIQVDSAATISLTSYHPDKLQYAYTAATDQLVVFSEMYYTPSKGWKVTIDGEPSDDFIKANYALRALKVPAGSHIIEMEFKPKSYYQGSTVDLIASILVLLAFFGAMYWWYNNFKPAEPEVIDDPEEKAAKPTTRKTVRKVQPKATRKNVKRPTTKKKKRR